MNKEQLQEKLQLAEARCKDLFDQKSTTEERVIQLNTELERTRGDYRTLRHLIDNWVDPIEETTAGSSIGGMPTVSTDLGHPLEHTTMPAAPMVTAPENTTIFAPTNIPKDLPKNKPLRRK